MSRGLDWKEWVGMELPDIKFSPGSGSLTAVDDFLIQVPITVIYKDDETLACVRPVCGRLLRRFGNDAFRMNMWPLSALGNSGAFARVFADTAESDIVMLALRAEEPLPALIKHLAQVWQAQRPHGNGAVGALFLSEENNFKSVIPADRELQAFLLAAGLNYFSEVVGRQALLTPSSLANIEGHALNLNSTFAGILRTAGFPNFHHWGINE